MSLKIIFAGTPSFASDILEHLLKSKHQVQAVLTQPDRPKGRGQSMVESPVKALAKAHGLPTYQVPNLKDPSFDEVLKSYAPDLMIVVAFGLIIPKRILGLPRLGCINVHASLLPRWRGASPIQQAILAGDTNTGITIMQMDPGLDTGDILKTSACPIEPTDTSQSLQNKLVPIAVKVLLETLEDFENQNISPIKQDDNQSCYAPKILKQDGKIDWNDPAAKIERKIRAFNPWPIAFAEIDDLQIRVYAAKISDADAKIDANSKAKNVSPGTILSLDEDAISVATGEGVFTLLELQLPGRTNMPVREILKSKRSLFAEGKQFK